MAISTRSRNTKASILRKHENSLESRLSESGDLDFSLNLSMGSIRDPAYYAITKAINDLGSIREDIKKGIFPYDRTGGTKESHYGALKWILGHEQAIDLKLKYDNNEVFVFTGNGGQSTLKEIFYHFDNIGTFGPPYPAFVSIPKSEGKTTKVFEKDYSKGKFTINKDQFVQYLDANNLDLFIINSPGNPDQMVINSNDLEFICDELTKRKTTILSDDAYAGIINPGIKPSSIWKFTNEDIPNIEGNRISMISLSKEGPACSLGAAAMVTDYKEFASSYHNDENSSPFENGASVSYMCPRMMSQIPFEAIADEDPQEIREHLSKLSIMFQERRDPYINGILGYGGKHKNGSKIEPILGEATCYAGANIGVEVDKFVKFVSENYYAISGGLKFSLIGTPIPSTENRFIRHSLLVDKDIMAEVPQVLYDQVEKFKHYIKGHPFHPSTFENLPNIVSYGKSLMKNAA